MVKHDKSYVTTPAARIDIDRQRRRGLPEVVYCEHKTPKHVVDIFSVFYERRLVALGTRSDRHHAEAVQKAFPKTVYDPLSRLLLYHPHRSPDQTKEFFTLDDSVATQNDATPYIAAVSAGTGDEPILREAVTTLKVFGHAVRVVHDAGVAGLDRITDRIDVLRNALVTIVVAGMDGALPSVVAGLISTPVIAVPTSVGYGANFGGLSALLAMLNNCSAGVSVVNIDNGFGAAYTAGLIARKVMNDAPRNDFGLESES